MLSCGIKHLHVSSSLTPKANAFLIPSVTLNDDLMITITKANSSPVLPVLELN